MVLAIGWVLGLVFIMLAIINRPNPNPLPPPAHISEELSALAAAQAGETGTLMRVGHGYFFSPAPARKEDVLLIELPPNPTPEECVRYIDAIRNFSRQTNNGRWCSWGDNSLIETKMAKVGGENLGLLLAALNQNSYGNYYTVKAIEILAGPEDKEMIIAELAEHHELISVVINNGWEEDVREILIEELKKDLTELPTQWIAAVASLNEPETYDHLVKYFIEGRIPGYTYRTLCRRLPHIVDDMVTAGWRQKHKMRMPQQIYRIAIARGNREALDAVITLSAEPLREFNVRALRSWVLPYIDFYGTDPEIKEWYEKYRDLLVFNEERRLFEVPGERYMPGAATDDAAIYQIRLSADPDREEYKEYIQRFMEIVETKNSRSYLDAEVIVLARVGADNVNLLLEAIIERDGTDPDYYLYHALDELITAEHKEIILENLEECPFLIEYFIRYHWEEEVRELLIERFKTDPAGCPNEWLPVIARFADPSTYPAFRNYFVRKYTDSMYGAVVLPDNTIQISFASNDYRDVLRDVALLRSLPGFAVDQVVNRTWEERDRNNYINRNLALAAIEYGNPDALAYAMELLADEKQYIGGMKAEWAILLYIDFVGDREQIIEWYAKNKDRLVFDRVTRTFYVSKENGTA